MTETIRTADMPPVDPEQHLAVAPRPAQPAPRSEVPPPVMVAEVVTQLMECFDKDHALRPDVRSRLQRRIGGRWNETVAGVDRAINEALAAGVLVQYDTPRGCEIRLVEPKKDPQPASRMVEVEVAELTLREVGLAEPGKAQVEALACGVGLGMVRLQAGASQDQATLAGAKLYVRSAGSAVAGDRLAAQDTVKRAMQIAFLLGWKAD